MKSHLDAKTKRGPTTVIIASITSLTPITVPSNLETYGHIQMASYMSCHVLCDHSTKENHIMNWNVEEILDWKFEIAQEKKTR